jgi:hypothetical protein
MRIEADEPGSPDCVRTSTFGALPASALTTFGSLERRIIELSTVLITLPSFSRVVAVPAPVTTTSFRRSAFATSVKSSDSVPPASVTCRDCAV